MPGQELTPGELERDETAVVWVYGSILVAAAVAAASVVKATSGQVLLYAAAGMVVIWIAHSYAAFVGLGGRVDLPGRRRRALAALRAELPVLVAAAPTLAAVAVCWLTGADEETTGWVGLAVGIAVMIVMAVGAASRAGAERGGAVAAGASAALVGGAIVAAKAAIG